MIFTLNPLIDKQANNLNIFINSKNVIQEFMIETDLTDIWCNLNPNTRRYTWRRMSPSPVFVRLDFFIILASLQNITKNADILPSYMTDHSMPMIELCKNNAMLYFYSREQNLA